jgi:hypothetical protein
VTGRVAVEGAQSEILLASYEIESLTNASTPAAFHANSRSGNKTVQWV